MCKRRWRPYIASSPVKIVSQFGSELGNAILEKNIEAVSKAALRPGRWILRINEAFYPLAVNGILIPCTFDTLDDANLWLQGHLHEVGLVRPEVAAYNENNRIAYRCYSPVDQVHVIAEAVAVTERTQGDIQKTYLEAADTWARNLKERN